MSKLEHGPEGVPYFRKGTPEAEAMRARLALERRAALSGLVYALSQADPPGSDLPGWGACVFFIQRCAEEESEQAWQVWTEYKERRSK